MDTAPSKTPIHLWTSAWLPCCGMHRPVDYLMTRLRQDSGRDGCRASIRRSSTRISTACDLVADRLGLAFGAELVGSILLIARSRHAVPVFAVSLFGVALSLGWQLLAGPDMPPEMTASGSSQVMPYVIIVIAVALFLYARAMRIRGVLR